MQADNELTDGQHRHLYVVGLGANLPSKYGSPLQTLIAALMALEAANIRLIARSPWFESEPVPQSDQPWYINAVTCVSTLVKPNILLRVLHEIEIEFGRIRSVPNAPRPLDLDLLMGATIQPAPGYQSSVTDLSGNALVLPHPRLTQRAFVLRPLAAIVPDWVHPGTGLSVAQMTANLPPMPIVRVLRQ